MSGNAKLVLNCPSIYREGTKLYPRHIHYTYLDDDNHWVEDIETLEVLCHFPYDAMKKIVDDGSRILISAFSQDAEEEEKRNIPGTIDLDIKTLTDLPNKGRRTSKIRSTIKSNLDSYEKLAELKKKNPDMRTSDLPIVVYSENKDSTAADEMASILCECGYVNVIKYPGGSEEW